MTRPPTHPGEPTAETNFILIDSLTRKLGSVTRDIEALEDTVQALRDRMIAVAGEDGAGGKLGALLEKHDKSAASQGTRLEETSNKVAILMADRRIFQVLGAIAMLALGVLLKTLIDRASTPPRAEPEPAPSGLLLQKRRNGFASNELTPSQSWSDDAAEASSASVSPVLPGSQASNLTMER